MVSPLKRPLNIELYNDTFFPTNSKHIVKPSLYQAYYHIDTLAFQEHTYQSNMPTAQALFDEVTTSPPPVEVVTSKTLDVPQDGLAMSNK